MTLAAHPQAAGGADVVCAGVVHVYRAAGTDIAALRGIDLHVRAGAQVALLGASGSGKSTLLTLVAGIRQPSAGAIRVDGRDIARLGERDLHAYRANTVGTLLQGAADNLLTFATAVDNVRHAQRVRRRGKVRLGVDALLDAVELPAPQRRLPVQHLSPSRQQLVAMAVALANAPRLLVADEPTSQLDEVARDRLLDALLAFVGLLGTTVLVVTHDAAVAARMQRTLHLNAGLVGSEEGAGERFAVLGRDRSLQLPAEVAPSWSQGSRLRVEELDGDELRITRVDW
jgi:putative ABC transport system ATP-binding protein